MLSSAAKTILIPIMGVAYSPVVNSAELYSRKAVIPIDIINLDFMASDENKHCRRYILSCDQVVNKSAEMLKE